MSGSRSREGFLADAQRRLWRLITFPEGVRAALDSEHGEPPLATLVRSDDRLGAEHRLDVYANAYFYRILEVLEDDYPTLAAAMGADAFHDLATSYLAVHPSAHPSLRYIGQRLASFLRGSEAAEGVRSRVPWAPDLAAFEWAKGEVFDAVDAACAARSDLEGTPPDAFEALTLELIPAVRLLSLEWPVDALVADEEAEDVAAQATRLSLERTALCVWRRNERRLVRRVGALELEALEHAHGGIRFGALCELAAERTGEDDAPALAAGWLARWIDDELLLPLAR